MITVELEKAAHKLLTTALLAAVATSSAGALLPDGGIGLVDNQPFGLTGAFADGGIGETSDADGIPLAAGVNFYLYRGAGCEEINYPCAIITAEAGEEPADEFAGNYLCTLAVSVQMQAQPNDAAPTTDVAALLELAADAVTGSLCVADLPGDLNTARVTASLLTVIGQAGNRTLRTSGEGRARVHTYSVPLLCAGLDLT